jgi:hypothetical protein
MQKRPPSTHEALTAAEEKINFADQDIIGKIPDKCVVG